MLFFSHHTPIGIVTIFEDNGYIIKIDLKKYPHDSNYKKTNVISQCCNELDLYFSGQLTNFTVPIKLKGTKFQILVWQDLQNINYDQLKTYKDIAISIGNSKAYRAVGNACNKNPIPIIIPCHRAVGTNNLTGYAYGADIKKILLNIEINKEIP